MKSDLPRIHLNIPSPLYPLDLSEITTKPISLYIKREDQIHPWLSGNKWRKLKYNLDYLVQHQFDSIATFGGAYSNHLYAVAGAAHLLNLNSYGFVRGELDEHNPTIQFCQSKGMELIPLSRTDYKEKMNSLVVQEWIKNKPHVYFVPEGGTNELALEGVAEIWDEIIDQMYQIPDFVVLAAGTGGTAAGILKSAPNPTTKILAISALKTNYLAKEILEMSGATDDSQLVFNADYHFGGYGKWNHELINFIQQMKEIHQLELDHVYNGKAFYGLLDLIDQDFFPPESRILYIHTGGLQGLAGLEYRSR